MTPFKPTQGESAEAEQALDDVEARFARSRAAAKEFSPGALLEFFAAGAAVLPKLEFLPVARGVDADFLRRAVNPDAALLHLRDLGLVVVAGVGQDDAGYQVRGSQGQGGT